MIELASEYGRYGYRRITALLRHDGWKVNHKRIERLWRREGLKVPKKQPKRGRLWLNDGSCIRLRPQFKDHVWAYDFVHARTYDGRPLRMAQENPRWGYTTIRGALFNLGHTVARETVRNILKEHGIVPAPERRKRAPWSTFLKSHWDSIAAADFFTVEIWSRVGLTRYYVLFFIKLSDRRVHIAGITPQPHGSWIKQIARNITDPVDGFLVGSRYLIMDRDAIFTAEFRDFLKQERINAVRLPPRSPNLNAYAERFVRTIKESCLDRMILFGERSLRNAIREFLEHDHHERNHQGIENRWIDPQDEVGSLEGSIACRERLGGMLRYYYRDAA